MQLVVPANVQKSSGKIYEAYNFSVTPYNGFSITQSVEGMLYRIGDTKASFNTKSGVKNGIGRSSGAGIFYKVDLGTDEFGVIARIGSNFSRGSVDYVGGGSDSDKSWFAPAGGLGVRYNLNKLDASPRTGIAYQPNTIAPQISPRTICP